VPNALSPPVRAAVQRTRWLAELARSLDDAERAVQHLSDAQVDRGELPALRLRIAAVSRDVESLRRGRTPPVETLNPFWTS
jgi:hypothetical protein